MSDAPVICTSGLTRYFGARAAVNQLSLEVPQGGIFAFLGRNGSGKTTTIRMLLGLLQPTRGHATVLGCDTRALTPEVRARIGYLTEEHGLYGWMTVRQIADFQSTFFPRWTPRIFEGIREHFGLKDSARVKDLSRGERAGLALALTLAPDPDLLILDDPALGLDPVARRSLVESMIFLTRRSDRTIFFSTHQLTDVERVADYLAILDDGILRACCPLETLRNKIKEVRLRFAGQPPVLPSLPRMLQTSRMDKELRMTFVDYDAETEAALRALHPVELEPVPLSLENAIISYLGRRGEKSFILADKEPAS